MDLQTGVRVYTFVRDRQDEQRDEQHPQGHHAYVESWHEAHDLSQNYASAVQAGDSEEAGRFLGQLMDMADQWKSHPGYSVVSAGIPRH
ncbi:hypothetical protein [Streptomyces sp. XH2]|uniref:hypothetical protein n=1 Tax=Streptomyces sp. XH2 TaxID=3412483 RepID=UPI003C7E7C47